MKFEVLTIKAFEKHAKPLLKKYPSLRGELRELVLSLQVSPEQGTSIGNNCYKIRLAISSKGKGKSGGARVITYVLVDERSVWLLTLIDKSDKENVPDKEIAKLISTIDHMRT